MEATKNHDLNKCRLSEAGSVIQLTENGQSFMKKMHSDKHLSHLQVNDNFM